MRRSDHPSRPSAMTCCFVCSFKTLLTSTQERRRPERMPMKNPPHPGKAVRVSCLEPLGLSITGGAKVLGVARQSLSNLINGKTGISPEMAIRLSKAFGSTPETWIRMQAAYDLAQALKHEKQIRVERYAPPPAA